MPSGQETRVVNNKTGGQKGIKEDRYDLLPWDAIEEDALLYGIGARKYADRNWEKGYDWNLSVRAMMSHWTAWLRGEARDKEGFHHLAAMRFHAAALMRFEKNFPELDNVRPRPTPSAPPSPMPEPFVLPATVPVRAEREPDEIDLLRRRAEHERELDRAEIEYLEQRAIVEREGDALKRVLALPRPRIIANWDDEDHKRLIEELEGYFGKGNVHVVQG